MFLGLSLRLGGLSSGGGGAPLVFLVAGSDNALSVAAFDGGADWPGGVRQVVLAPQDGVTTLTGTDPVLEVSLIGTDPAYDGADLTGADPSFGTSMIGTDPGVSSTATQNIVPASRPLLHASTPQADGFGWALQFVRDLLAARPGANVVLVPAGEAGTSMAEWASGGAAYADAVSRTQRALTETGGTFAGALLHLGEADAGSATFAANLDAMIGAMRSAIPGASDAPVVVGGLAPAWVGANADRLAVQSAIEGTAVRVPLAAYAASTGLTVSSGSTFDAASMRTLGSRYYDAWSGLDTLAFAPIQMADYEDAYGPATGAVTFAHPADLYRHYPRVSKSGASVALEPYGGPALQTSALTVRAAEGDTCDVHYPFGWIAQHGSVFTPDLQQTFAAGSLWLHVGVTGIEDGDRVHLARLAQDDTTGTQRYRIDAVGTATGFQIDVVYNNNTGPQGVVISSASVTTGEVEIFFRWGDPTLTLETRAAGEANWTAEGTHTATTGQTGAGGLVLRGVPVTGGGQARVDFLAYDVELDRGTSTTDLTRPRDAHAYRLWLGSFTANATHDGFRAVGIIPPNAVPSDHRMRLVVTDPVQITTPAQAIPRADDNHSFCRFDVSGLPHSTRCTYRFEIVDAGGSVVTESEDFRVWTLIPEGASVDFAFSAVSCFYGDGWMADAPPTQAVMDYAETEGIPHVGYYDLGDWNYEVSNDTANLGLIPDNKLPVILSTKTEKVIQMREMQAVPALHERARFGVVTLSPDDHETINNINVDYFPGQANADTLAVDFGGLVYYGAGADNFSDPWITVGEIVANTYATNFQLIPASYWQAGTNYFGNPKFYGAQSIGRARMVLMDGRHERGSPLGTLPYISDEQKAWLFAEFDAFEANPNLDLMVLMAQSVWGRIGARMQDPAVHPEGGDSMWEIDRPLYFEIINRIKALPAGKKVMLLAGDTHLGHVIHTAVVAEDDPNPDNPTTTQDVPQLLFEACFSGSNVGIGGSVFTSPANFQAKVLSSRSVGPGGHNRSSFIIEVKPSTNEVVVKGWYGDTPNPASPTFTTTVPMTFN